MKTIGLIGGMSWVSTELYYREINTRVQQTLGGSASADVLLHSLNFAAIEALQSAGDWELLATMLTDSARRLTAAGAACILICSNTMHRVAPAVEAGIDVPLIHIADPLAQSADQAGLQTLGLLGTRYTMEQPFLSARLAAHGLRVLTPDPPARARLHAIIFDELVRNIVTDQSRAAAAEIIGAMQQQGIDSVVLACTELSLLIGPTETALPRLDTTALHAQAAVDFALDGKLPPGPNHAAFGSGALSDIRRQLDPGAALARVQALYGHTDGGLGTALFIRPGVSAEDLEEDARAVLRAFAHRPERADRLQTVWQEVLHQPQDDIVSLAARLLDHANFQVRLQADQLINNHDAGRDETRAALDGLFVTAEAQEQRVYLYGDDEQLSGLIIASRRANETVYLISLFD